jgi:CubicO group peptidase (beta-lactamase class C family)
LLAGDAACSNDCMALARLFLVGFVVACAPAGGGDDGGGDDDVDGVPEGDLPIEARFQVLAHQIEAERVELAAPGVSVLLMENGKVVFARGFGVRNPSASTPADSRTLYRIGSVTKSMTAAALLGLVASGQVALADPATKTIPEFSITAQPGIAQTITVNHLLTHTSGLADILGPDDAPPTDGGLAAYVAGGFKTDGYTMAPAGRMWNYTNPGFSLAGLVLERAAQTPCRRAITERVLSPLAMKRTLWTGAEVIADGNYAHGLYINDAGTQRVDAPDAYDNDFFAPAGNAFSSVWDLGRWVTFFLDGNEAALADAQRRAMQEPQFNTELWGPLYHYGFGLFVEEGIYTDAGFHAVRVVSHGGDIYGFAADVTYVPSTGFAFIVLANTDYAHFYKSARLALGSFAGLPAPTTPPNLDPDPASYASLVGTYQDDFSLGRVIITKQGNQLRASMPDLDAAQVTYSPMLVATSKDNFTMTIDGYEDEFTFLRNAQGQVEYMRSRWYVAQRTMTVARSAPPRVDVAALRAQLRRSDDRPSRH